MFLEICMQIHSVVFALRRQINKQNVCENNLLCASNNVFVKYQAQGGGLTPTPLAHAIAEYKLSALQVSISEEIQATLRYSSSQLQKYQAAY